jgi:hypothetical protein
VHSAAGLRLARQPHPTRDGVRKSLIGNMVKSGLASHLKPGCPCNCERRVRYMGCFAKDAKHGHWPDADTGGAREGFVACGDPRARRPAAMGSLLPGPGDGHGTVTFPSERRPAWPGAMSADACGHTPARPFRRGTDHPQPRRPAPCSLPVVRRMREPLLAYFSFPTPCLQRDHPPFGQLRARLVRQRPGP